ncbi:MAG: universal stress protein [Anaerovoracaceae bacterium]|jgi:K+-sensing histidine kinase KdpD|nr:universal stress protein [Anaerovoracaceae bacterium]
MNNILVCVTQQKKCERLIKYGKELAEGSGGEMIVVHIAQYSLDQLADSDAAESLEYLYQKAVQYDSNFIIVRSGNVPATLASMIAKNNVTKIVMGQTRKADINNSTINAFEGFLHDDVEVIVVPEDIDSDNAL